MVDQVKRLVVLFFLLAGSAHAQTLIGPCMNGGPCAPSTLGPVGSLSITGAGTALSVTNNASLGGATTFGSGTQDKLTITGGATGGTAVTLSTSGLGGTQFNAPLTIKYNPTTITNGGCAYLCTTGFLSGTLTANQLWDANLFTINDNTTSAVTSSVFYGIRSLTLVAPNGGTASGPVTAHAFNLTQVGTLQGGTITNTGISTALNGTIFMQSNLGGTPTLTAGAGNAFTSGCIIFSTSSYVTGCSSTEMDVGTMQGTLTATLSNGSGGSGTVLNVTAVGSTSGIFLGSAIEGTNVPYPCYVASLGTGTGGVGSAAIGTYNLTCSANVASEGMTVVAPFDQGTALLLAEISNTPDVGRLGPAIGAVVTGQAGTPGFISAYQVGLQEGGSWAIAATGKILYAALPNPATPLPWEAASGVDLASVKFHTFTEKFPFQEEVPLQAIGFTGAKRLTTDGSAAFSYLYDTAVSAHGTGYTSLPTVSDSNCTGSDIEAELGSNGIVGALKVRAAGSCPAEAAGSVSITGGGGSGATGYAVISGNTLNFPINSVVDVTCTVTASELAHSGSSLMGAHITFLAKMGATASTAAIIGSPTWTSDGTSGSDTLTMAAPTADTTLGAINISTNAPSAGTWDAGGRCVMTKTAQL